MGIGGKVLKNKSLKECYYYDSKEYNNLCIPKDFEPNCLKGDEFKTCEDGEMVSSDGQCGKDHGKCPYSECCSKDGKCGTTEEFCNISNNCQTEYGYCIDECEIITKQLKKLNDNLYFNCVPNKNKKVQSL